MANTSRRIIDDDGKEFVPMNVEGNLGEEDFITVPKLVALAIIVISIIGWIAIAKSNGYTIIGTLLILLIILIIDSIILRYVVFEEPLYYDMYKELKDSCVVSPYKLWNIGSKQNALIGTLLSYNDGKVGIIVRLERDVITGRKEDYKEEHFDALSDFYKELNRHGIKRVRMDIMEPTGNDKRLAELDKLCNTTDNYNVNRLVELSTTHIKNISAKTLSDVEYYLLYTENFMEQQKFIEDATDCLEVLLQGGYAGYEILGEDGERQLNEFAKQINFVDYFNTDEAALRIFNSVSTQAQDIVIVNVDTDKGTVNIDNTNSFKLQSILNGKIDVADIYDTLTVKDSSVGVDIDEIESNVLKGNLNTASYTNSNSTENSKDMIDF